MKKIAIIALLFCTIAGFSQDIPPDSIPHRRPRKMVLFKKKYKRAQVAYDQVIRLREGGKLYVHLVNFDNSIAILKEKDSGKVKAVPTYYAAYINHTSAYIIKDTGFVQLADPFPYFINLSDESNPYELKKIAKKLNGSLYEFYIRAKKRKDYSNIWVDW